MCCNPRRFDHISVKSVEGSGDRFRTHDEQNEEATQLARRGVVVDGLLQTK